MEFLALAALFASFGLQAVYWLGPFLRLLLHRPPENRRAPSPPISIVICAKNEADNLQNNLYHFLNQTYRSFEIIVVDDNSTDATRSILLDVKTKWSNLHVVCAPKSERTFSKKKALAKGLEAARFEWVVVSDADCRPASPEWLSALSRHMHRPIQFVLGYSPYERKQGWLNRWIRFEGLWTAIQYLAAALAGLPYMGVGRNMGYELEVFREAGGFSSHEALASGDDDLFVNQMARANRTAIEINPKAFVWSKPNESWRGYYYQKRRHLSTAHRYRGRSQFWLLAYSVSHVLFYTAALFSARAYPEWVFLLFGLRWVMTGAVGGRLAVKLGQPDLARYWIALDVMLLVYYVTFLPSLFQRRHPFGNR